jgi:hypothetical protein
MGALRARPSAARSVARSGRLPGTRECACDLREAQLAACAVFAETRLNFPSCKWRLISVRTSGMSLGGGLALIAAGLQRRHAHSESFSGVRAPVCICLLHCFLVLAQDAPALGGLAPVRSHIQEYDDLPVLEDGAMQVPAKQFLNESIELRQSFIAAWFGHDVCHFH